MLTLYIKLTGGGASRQLNFKAIQLHSPDVPCQKMKDHHRFTVGVTVDTATGKSLEVLELRIESVYWPC